MTIDKPQIPLEETAAALPDDVVALKALVLQQRAQLATRVAEIEHLKLLIAKLRRMQFGRSSERLDRQIDQMELRLEELQTAQAELAPVVKPRTEEKSKPVRRPLPEHLPRERVVHEPSCTCPDCGTAMKKIGEDVSEVLDYVPAARCVELKSLKLYVWSYRNVGAFHEAVTNRILEDLVRATRPRFMRLTAKFNVRGGIFTTVVAEHTQRGWMPAPEVRLDDLPG